MGEPCWIGEPSAPAVCDMYGQLADQLGDGAHWFNARALPAVAVYRQASCVLGCEELRQLATDCRGSGGAVLATLTAAQQVMTDECISAGYRRVPCEWAPVPGGYLCPVETPWPSDLAGRALRHPRFTDCRRRLGRGVSSSAGGWAVP